MLATLLRQKMDSEKLAVRPAAKQIGVSHTTLLRAIRGDTLDLTTVLQFSKWLDVEPTALLNSMNTSPTSLGSEIAVVLGGTPKLERAFRDAMEFVRTGKADPDLIRDIAAYAAYRIGLLDDRGT